MRVEPAFLLLLIRCGRIHSDSGFTSFPLRTREFEGTKSRSTRGALCASNVLDGYNRPIAYMQTRVDVSV